MHSPSWFQHLQHVVQQRLNIVVHDGADESPDMDNVEHACESLWQFGKGIPDVELHAWKLPPSWKVACGDIESIE